MQTENQRPGKSIACVLSHFSRVQFFITPWTVACQAPLSMELSRQGYWSGLPCPSGDLPDQEIEPGSPALQADSLPSEPPGKPHVKQYIYATDTDQWTSSFQECFRAVVYVFSEGLRVETASQDN